MAGQSNIEWTDATWNPVTGCTRVSAGCDHCYAVAMTHRLEGASLGAPGGQRDRGKIGLKYAGLTVVNGKGERHFNGKVRCHEDVLRTPFFWKKTRRIFVNSMSDLFHPYVPFEFIDTVFAVMSLCPQHTFQILTKRPERMFAWFGRYAAMPARLAYRVGEEASRFLDCAKGGAANWTDDGALSNVWLGTSVENQQTADQRIPYLLSCPAAVRFVSYEPALGPVDFKMRPNGDRSICCQCGERHEGSCFDHPHHRGLDWIIVGGESGPGARPMHSNWARAVRDQCKAASIPMFFKQWGEWLPAGEDGISKHGAIHANCSDEPIRVGKSRAGATLDGREHREFPTIANRQLAIGNPQ